LEYCGGKGNNAARALSRLGVAVTATGFQGGYTGEIASNQLALEGVATEFVTCAHPTRISTMLHEQDTGLTYAIYEPGQPASEEEIRELLRLFRKLVSRHEIVLFCGSAQTESLQPVFPGMISIARQEGLLTMLDSSGKALRRGISAGPYLVKVNREELQSVLGVPMDSGPARLEALKDLCQGGITIAAMTLGEDGLIATDGEQAWQGGIPIQDVINTVGCGDSTLAGMAFALNREAELADIVRWGTAFGSANTQVHGAGFISPEIVNELFDQVELKRLA
jgi:1-phosphofructokinase family hexose kinase